MEYPVMMCDCCGKTFYSRYWEDGYIDHMNFANNLETYISRGIDDVVQAITRSGNKYRNKYSVDTRLECFKKYCENNSIEDVYKDVECEVSKYLEHLNKLDKVRKDVGKLVRDLSYEDKEYIGLGYQEY